MIEAIANLLWSLSIVDVPLYLLIIGVRYIGARYHRPLGRPLSRHIPA